MCVCMLDCRERTILILINSDHQAHVVVASVYRRDREEYVSQRSETKITLDRCVAWS